MSNPVNDQTILQKAAKDPKLAAALREAGIEVPLPQFVKCSPGTLCSRNSKPFGEKIIAVSADLDHWVLSLSDVQREGQFFLNKMYDWHIGLDVLIATPKIS